jgi:4-hydroxy-tetrahydrodipicolinate reductase
MDIVLSGYGKMGKVIEGILAKRNHKVVKTFDNEKDYAGVIPVNAVCIDFSMPDAFRKNYKIIADNFSGAVVGTTGWGDIEDEVTEYFRKNKKSLVYASNFSLGVNIYFRALDFMSGLISKHADYDPYIIELHHNEKKDAPSGTAKSIQQILKKNFGRDIDAASVRSGFIKGIHETGFESEYDKITFRHEAYSREGFALGAVIAAELLLESAGVWKFDELLKSKLKEK